MELIKKRIHYIREGKKIFDQFYVDEDYNVPEAKEDVGSIVDTGTELKIEEIRPVENYVRITGKLYFRILYLNVSSDPKPGVLEGKLPFEEMVYAEKYDLIVLDLNFPGVEGMEILRELRKENEETESACDGGTGSRQGKAGR